MKVAHEHGAKEEHRSDHLCTFPQSVVRPNAVRFGHQKLLSEITRVVSRNGSLGRSLRWMCLSAACPRMATRGGQGGK